MIQSDLPPDLIQRLPLPDDLPPGGYTIVAGFYDPVADERMANPLPVATLLSPSSKSRD